MGISGNENLIRENGNSLEETNIENADNGFLITNNLCKNFYFTKSVVIRKQSRAKISNYSYLKISKNYVKTIMNHIFLTQKNG